MNNPASRPRWPEKAAFFLISAYQAVLSPVLAMGGGGCRHLPTCSHYCKDCIGRHGLWAGLWMGAARLARCHPWGTKGYDPAPELKPEVSPFTPWKYGAWSWKRLPAAPGESDQSNDGVSHGVR